MAMLDSLMAYYSCDEASGNLIDAHSTHDGTETSGTIATTTGKVGDCRDLEAGDTERFVVTDHADLSPGDADFSIAVWVNFESLGANRAILHKGSTTTDVEYEVFYSLSANRLRFQVTADGTTFVTEAADNLGAPSTATWYLIICWHDATANTLNIQVNDGTADSGSHSTGIHDGTSSLVIGSRPSSAEFDGLIDEIAIAKRVWTADERTWIYNSGNGRSYADWAATEVTATANPMLLMDHYSGGMCA